MAKFFRACWFGLFLLCLPVFALVAGFLIAWVELQEYKYGE